LTAATGGQHGFSAGQRVRPELGPPAEQVGEPFVLVGGLPDVFGKGAQHLSPTVSGRPDLGVDRIDHQVEQLLLGGDVAVQPHRSDVQRRGDLAQRHRVQAVRIGELDRRLDDPPPAQRGRHRSIRRLRPLPHQHAATIQRWE
jgi:hypothetical protein